MGIHKDRPVVTLAALSLAAVLLAACAGNGVGLDANGNPICSESSAPEPLTADFQSIQDNVVTPICTRCHSGANAPEGLQLDQAHSYALLVGVPSAEVPGVLRVKPGDPADSYVIQKLQGSSGIVGVQMPAAHANIVNMSLAGPADPLLARLVKYGAMQGMIFVGAAGAAGSGSHFPADLDEVLAVDAAEDSAGNPHHLRAPGREVLTLVPGGHYDFASGSSLAAAEVSGIVALMLAERPHLTATDLRTVLLRSSRSVSSPAGEILAVDACAALSEVAEQTTCGPGIRAAAAGLPR